ncbi:MAG: hypothetical protein AAF307_12660 [Pseudomonadota bacterium]
MGMILGHLAYFSGVALLLCMVPQGFLGNMQGAQGAVIVIGTLGIWRYSWATLNFSRALWFRRVVYPRWRKLRAARFAKSTARHH